MSVLEKSSPLLAVLAKNDLGDDIRATPAVAGGVIYLHTASGLAAFGQQQK